MDRYKKHLFICVNERPENHPKGCCFSKNGMQVFRRFRAELTDRGIRDIYCTSKAGCLSQCEKGPMVVVYPEGIWYAQVTEDDVPEIIDQHLLNDIPVERLRIIPT